MPIWEKPQNIYFSDFCSTCSGFIESTKEEVKQMKQQINSPADNHVQVLILMYILSYYKINNKNILSFISA